MNRTIRQRQLLIFFLCAESAISLAKETLLQGAASHNPNGILARGMAGHRKTLPALEQQQVDSANARPTFQEAVALESIGATAAPSEQAELVVFNKPCRPQTGLLRAHCGRAPPCTFSR